MSMNRIQFQPGLSMPEFLKQFGTEVQCESELEQARWPQGFVCTCCTHTGHSVFIVGSHKTFQCQACRHQTSLIAGTLFQSTRLPLTIWLLAIYLISQDWLVRAGSEAVSGGQLSHSMAHSAQAHGGHVRARNEVHPQRPSSNR